MDAAQWSALDALIAERDPHCRGVVVLGLNAPVEQLAAGFAAARRSRSARGFAVGRTLFHEPARAWLAGEIDDPTLVARAAANFATLIRHWQAAKP
jgi:5-dehydro-2-deoxygluconokinase